MRISSDVRREYLARAAAEGRLAEARELLARIETMPKWRWWLTHVRALIWDWRGRPR